MKMTTLNEDINTDCVYAIRLLNRLRFLNKIGKRNVDIEAVTKAIYYAKKYHGDQKRQSGEPYYSHPLEVAYMIADYLPRTDVIVASILHDTLEDTNLTYEEIKETFGTAVAEKVEGLTRIKANGKISSKELVESLWKEKKYDTLLIKQFDRLHNIQTIGSKSPEKIQKIINETMSTFVVLAAYLGIREVEDELVALCRKFVKKSIFMDSSELDLANKEDTELLSLISQNEISPNKT